MAAEGRGGREAARNEMCKTAEGWGRREGRKRRLWEESWSEGGLWQGNENEGERE